MHERVRAAGGYIVIRTKPGFGTVIEVSLPLGGERKGSVAAQARQSTVLSFSNKRPL
jgi:signal transduction histidine kinase